MVADDGSRRLFLLFSPISALLLLSIYVSRLLFARFSVSFSVFDSGGVVVDGVSRQFFWWQQR